MRQDGSSEEDIENVIKKLKNGETLESEKPESEHKVFFSNEQIEEEMDGFYVTEVGTQEQITRYEDGSYTKVELEIEDIENDVNTLASTGSFMTVTVRGSNVLTEASYSSRLYIDTHLGNNYIDSVYSPSIDVYVGNYEDDQLVIGREHENRSEGISAKSYLTFKRVAPQAANTYYLRLHTGDHLNDQYGIWVDFTSGSASYE